MLSWQEYIQSYISFLIEPTGQRKINLEHWIFTKPKVIRRYQFQIINFEV